MYELLLYVVKHSHSYYYITIWNDIEASISVTKLSRRESLNYYFKEDIVDDPQREVLCTSITVDGN